MEGLSTIRRHPTIGRLREDVGPGIRVFRTARRGIDAPHGYIYRVKGKMIQVARLVHLARYLPENAGPAMDQALESLRAVKAKPGEVTGQVRLTVPSISVTLVLTELLPRFIARYPMVEVEVHVEDRLVNAVAGEFDGGMHIMLVSC